MALPKQSIIVNQSKKQNNSWFHDKRPVCTKTVMFQNDLFSAVDT
jgi:hypothetical protein